jgi:hypothetical protein
MISKYNQFLINESTLILEAFLSADTSFLSKLYKISRQSNTSSTIADMILSRINDKDWVSEIDLKQDFFKTTDDKDKVSFIQTNRIKDEVKDPYNMPGRTDVKVGRAIKYIAKDLYDIKITDKQIEDFVNVYKSIADEGEDDFRFYVGDEIKSGYTEKNYSDTSSGTLGSSCMTGHPSFLKIYTKNEKKVRLLVLLEDGKICGRALVWKLDKSPCDAEYFMDRVYTNRDYEVNKFTQYADKNGWLYKQSMACGDTPAVKFKYNGKEVFGEISVKVDGKHSKYPYMDTLFCLNKDKDELSNVPSWKCYRLWDTDGDRERCDDCEGKSKNKNLCYGCSEGVMVLKQAGIEIDVEKGRERDK